ncbi:hypothetical protein EXN66_Car016522 [Channa argus]|uniref:Uncharacterized protein n=1 Tax=Channa argus TaxID=215402 RepID=A0A6G1QEI4_CHAAH|nr:hypothetical protein EXN66_Car016522 [Channa argus]
MFAANLNDLHNTQTQPPSTHKYPSSKLKCRYCVSEDREMSSVCSNYVAA